MVALFTMNDVVTIRKTVGKPLTERSPFERLERLRRNARPFTINANKHTEDDRVLVRKTVGAPCKEQG